uniref:Uncharacterized protein n=1 Tax=Amphimedon queenslandica TaxID=400682 RepID=A0A1X7SUG9_AMPQE
VSAVENLKFNSTSLLITWSHPVYFSNDVPFGSPLSYQVVVTDEEDGDIILDTNTGPNTHMYIAVLNITQCDTINISEQHYWVNIPQLILSVIME